MKISLGTIKFPTLSFLAADGDPFEEALHPGALAPHEAQEFLRVEIGGFVAEKSLHAPLDVGRFPGRETVAFRDNPVIAQRVQHGVGSPCEART